MIGTISFIREKEGTRGKYLTLALEDGTKGLVVNDEKIMEAVKEGETYNFTVEKSDIFTIVTDAVPTSEQGEAKKDIEPKSKKPQYKVGSPPGSKYQSEFMRKRTPEETEIIAKQAFSKSLIEAYARLWVADKGLFADLTEFNDHVKDTASDYVAWLEIKEK